MKEPHIVKAQEITFWCLCKMFIDNYKKTFIFFLLILILSWFFFYNSDIKVIIFCFLIVFFNLYASYLFHEYLHLLIIKKFCPTLRVKIEFRKTTISIIPLSDLKTIAIFYTAVTPAILLGLIGMTLLIYSNIINNFFLEIIGFTYFLHIINIIPPFSDGMMLLKVYVRYKEGR